MNIAIVDDNENDRKNILNLLNDFADSENLSIKIFQYDSGDKFLFNYKPIFDLIFMDIEMPGTDGFETSKNLRKLDQYVPLVFVTNIAGFAIKGYEVNALDYLVKPVDKESLLLKLSRINKIISENGSDKIIIRSGEENVVIKERDVTYLEIDGHYVIWHTLNDSYKTYSTLKDAISNLKLNVYEFCNRCYYVNLKYVDKVDKEYVYINNDKLLISHPKYKTFLNSLARYIGKGGSL